MSKEKFEWGIRHAPGRCCPDYDCLYGSWDQKHCRECGRDCNTCKLYKSEVKRHKKAEAELLTINNNILNKNKRRG